MVSYLIEVGQMDLLTKQLVAQQCYQVTVDTRQIDLARDKPKLISVNSQ